MSTGTVFFFPVFSSIPLCLLDSRGNVGAAAGELFVAYWGKWITGQTFFFQCVISRTKVPPLLVGAAEEGKKKHAEISAAVAVVVELNTPLALPPLINKTSKCFGRKGAACITLSLDALWTLCLLPWHRTHAYTYTHNNTHWFSPFSTLSLALSHPRFPHIHSENIHAYTQTLTWKPHWSHCIYMNARVHKKTQPRVPGFNVWIIASSLIDVGGTEDKLNFSSEKEGSDRHNSLPRDRKNVTVPNT